MAPGNPCGAGEAASEGAAEPPPIPPEDVAAEVAAAVQAVQGAKPVGSELCLDAVRRLRQLLSNYDEPPFKEAVQGGEAGWRGWQAGTQPGCLLLAEAGWRRGNSRIVLHSGDW